MRQRRSLKAAVLLISVPAVFCAIASSPSSPVVAPDSSAAAPPRQHEEARLAKMDSTGARKARPRLSKRALDTEPAHIEAVLSRYADMSPPPANLAQGVAHWDPPPAALRQMETGLRESANHRYGPALGDGGLRDALVRKLEAENGLDMAGQEVRLFKTVYQCCAFVSYLLCCEQFRVSRIYVSALQV